MAAKAWVLTLSDFRDHVTEVVFKDENGVPIDLSGYGASFVVAHENGEITWSVGTGHVGLASPTTLGKIVLTVPRAQISVLEFENAKFEFFLDLPGGIGSDKIYAGQVRHE